MNLMTTDYNTIAAEYQKAKQQPWRMHIEHFTLFELIGDLQGMSVLDLACGGGFYTRFLKRYGAARVVGIDLSAKVIELARAAEAKEPLGIEYHVHDAREPLGMGGFDLVTAAYLLNYASTPEELHAMCQGIGRSLKPGGRFVTVNNHPEQPPEFYPDCRKYGFLKTLPDGPPREGAPVDWTFFLNDGSDFTITNYILSTATHEWALRAAGLNDIRWHHPRLAPAGAKDCAPDYWRVFLEHPPIVFLECRR